VHDLLAFGTQHVQHFPVLIPLLLRLQLETLRLRLYLSVLVLHPA
jgi:hypothetical protein